MPDLLNDFFAGAPQSQEFFEASFLKPEDRRSIVQQVSKRQLHPTIIQLLKDQNNSSLEAVDTSLAKLNRAGVTCVVTGQQLGVCGGPLFTLYKILSAIKLSTVLEKELGSPIVPIFWLQSEDHDFEEIRGTTFYSKSRELINIAIQQKDPAFEDSCGNFQISKEDAEPLASSIRAVYAGREHAELLAALLYSYREGQTLSQALAAWIQTLCARFGLLTFDPNSRAVKTHMSELIASSIVRSQGISRVLDERTRWITNLGYEVQVPVREASPLFFMAVDTPNGGRRRIRLTESPSGSFDGPTVSFTKEELFNILAQEPERFTSSALIRPILQDTIFPTVAYVCGPSEFNYWVQLKPLYKFFGITQPLVVPRASFTIWEEKESRLLEKNEITLADLENDFGSLLKDRLVGTSSDPEAIFSKVSSQIESALESLRSSAETLDKGGLIGNLDLTKSSIIHNLDKFKGKWARALAQQDEALASAFQRLKAYAYPSDKPQERIISMSYFPLVYGPAFLDKVLSAIDPLKPGKMHELVVP